MKKRLLASLVCLVLLVGSLAAGATTKTLNYGDEGPDVISLQRRLRELNYNPGIADGKYGYKTYLAVRDFQYQNGLKVDGLVGETTYILLFSSKAVPNPKSPLPAPVPYPGVNRVQYGDQGPGVTLVQNALKGLGYFSDAIDGVFGYSTVLAVRHFQRINKLQVDGIVGPDTWAVLSAIGAIPAPGPVVTPPYVAPTPLPTPAPGQQNVRIAYGDRNNLVTDVQTRLKTLGYYTGIVDGAFGYTTKQAVERFQRANNLKADGVVGPITWEKMMAATAIPVPTAKPAPTGVPVVPETPAPSTLRLEMGSSGLQVQQLQEKLIALKFYSGPLDGKYGYSTVVAVRAFQKANGLKADGIVGPLTWNKLFGGAPLPKPTATPVPGVPTLAPTPVGPTPKPTPTPAPGAGIKLSYGMKNALVGQMQERLKALGYYGGAVDSAFGYTTYQAVRSFQRYNNLKVDGVVGPTTWAAMMGPSPVYKPK